MDKSKITRLNAGNHSPKNITDPIAVTKTAIGKNVIPKINPLLQKNKTKQYNLNRQRNCP
jgi:hypothetical protein